MRFQVTLDRDEDGVWVVECPSIPGCVSQGATREEALKNIEEAIALCLEVRALSRGRFKESACLAEP
ncbi:MAG TPA: type II toxin-antitoxin system HicB family antitoxin [Thermoanaerobaculia bacterium]|nr:type II toxin-antitoxin system HicB family antitoxin [Thermoanaerobaculia bacterium]